MKKRTTSFIKSLTLLAILLAGCADDAGTLGECPPGSQNQQNFGANIIFVTCTGCHSVELTGADRYGAPVDMDYDTPATVFEQAEEIYEIVKTGTMPPPDGLNADQIESVRVYLACNVP